MTEVFYDTKKCDVRDEILNLNLIEQQFCGIACVF